MTEDERQTELDTGGERHRVDILDALLAELEADDGTRTAAFRRHLGTESTATAERLAAVEDELASLRAEVDDLASADARRRAAIENELQPRLDDLERRLREIDDKVTNVRAETGGLRTEVTGVRDSLEAASKSEPASGDDPDIEALADDLADLERTVVDAFRTVTSDVEGDLESLQATFREDIAALERRLDALEAAARADGNADTDDPSS
ncbi:hypothetical protein [Natrinema sp. 74]|uniref:hypothetical protein n=1 Tax=Natrinema sp. 74 TaxID=3384159 RepID=UPI0038D41508